MKQRIIQRDDDVNSGVAGDKSPEGKSGDKSPHSKGWTNDRIDLLEGVLLTLANQYGGQPEAGAVFANHHHFLAHGCEASR